MPITKNLANNDREWKALLRGDDRNVVRTMSEWKKLLTSRESPLAGVNEKVVSAFSKNLKFKNGGLAHADYSMIVGVVPFSQFRRIWENFGMSLKLFTDHEGYSCLTQGTCQKMADYICLSNC